MRCGCINWVGLPYTGVHYTSLHLFEFFFGQISEPKIVIITWRRIMVVEYEERMSIGVMSLSASVPKACGYCCCLIFDRIACRVTILALHPNASNFSLRRKMRNNELNQKVNVLKHSRVHQHVEDHRITFGFLLAVNFKLKRFQRRCATQIVCPDS